MTCPTPPGESEVLPRHTAPLRSATAPLPDEGQGRDEIVAVLPEPGRTLTVVVDGETRERCEGSGLVATDRGRLFGTCPVCKDRLVIVDEETSVLWTHARVGVVVGPDDSPFPRFHLFRRTNGAKR